METSTNTRATPDYVFIVIDVLKVVTLVSIIFMSVAVGLFAIHTSSKVDTTITKVNVDLDEAHRLILEAGLTAMEARKASAEERAALPGLTKKANETLDNVNAVLVSTDKTLASIRNTSDSATVAITDLQGTILTAQKSIAQIDPVLAQAQVTIASVQAPIASLDKTTKDLDALISDPDIPLTLSNAKEMTGDGVKMTHDAQKWWHDYLFPGPWKRFFGYVEEGAEVGVKVFVP